MCRLICSVLKFCECFAAASAAFELWLPPFEKCRDAFRAILAFPELSL
jgi:hypothetical protein